MKKSLFYVAILYSFFFSFELFAQKIDVLTKKEVVKDLKYLKKYLKDSYIVYDENYLKNEELGNIDIQILNELFLSNKSEVSVQEFQRLLIKELKKNIVIPDSHLTVFSSENVSKIFPHNDIYFPGIVLGRQNESFIVFEDYNEDIKKGSVYTGKSDNVFPIVDKDGTLKYQYGIKSSKSVKLCNFPFDGQNSNVLLKSQRKDCQVFKNEKKEDIYIQNDTIFLSNIDFSFSEKYIKRCPIGPMDIHNYSVVIDLRDNSGGNTSGVLDYVRFLLFANNELISKDALKDFFSKGKKTLISSEVWNANIELAKTFDVPKTSRLKMGLLRWVYDLFNIKKITTEESNRTNNELLFSNTFFPQKIIILMNRNTSSAAELLIADLHYLATERIIMYGENSAGCVNFVGNYKYILPNSKIGICLSNTDERALPQLRNSKFHGETNGFYPDYWGIPDNIF